MQYTPTSTEASLNSTAASSAAEASSSMYQSRSLHNIQSTPNLGNATGGSYTDVTTSPSWNSGLAQEAIRPWEEKENVRKSGYPFRANRSANNYENISSLELSDPVKDQKRIADSYPFGNSQTNGSGRNEAWSDSSTPSQDVSVNRAPKIVGYQPMMLNSQMEEKMSSGREIRRYLEENQQRSPKDNKPMPVVAKANIGDSFQYNSSIPETYSLKSEMRKDNDSEYVVSPAASPAERDLSHNSNHSPPPPLPKTAPPTDIPSHLHHTSPTVMFVSRTTPCYNTSTQTEDFDTPGSSSALPSSTSPTVSATTSSMVASMVSSSVSSVSSPPWEQKSIYPNREHLATPPGTFANKDTAMFKWDNLSKPTIQAPKSLTASLPAFNATRDVASGFDDKPRSPTKRDAPSWSEQTEMKQAEKDFNQKNVEDELARIHDHAPSQTVMLRKLSKEFFGAQAAANPAMTKLHLELQQQRQNNRSSSSHSSTSQKKSGTSESAVEAEDTLGPLSPDTDNVFRDTPHFLRQTTGNMSMRKAYGTFDPVDMTDRPFSRRPLVAHGKALSTSNVQPAPARSMVSTRTNQNVQVVEVTAPGLRRTSSEQITPNAPMSLAPESNSPLPPSSYSQPQSQSTEVTQVQMRRKSPQQQQLVPDHARHTSDPVQNKRRSSGSLDGTSMKRAQSQALMSFYEKKTGKRLSGGEVTSSSPPTSSLNLAVDSERRLSTRIPKSSSSDNTTFPDSAFSTGAANWSSSNDTSVLQPWTSQPQSLNQTTSQNQSTSQITSPKDGEASNKPAQAGTSDEDTTHPKYIEALTDPDNSATSPVSPNARKMTKDDDQSEDESPPPTLPPRNYLKPKQPAQKDALPLPQQQQQQQQKQQKVSSSSINGHNSRRSTGSSSSSSGSFSSGGGGGSLSMYTNDYDQTPKPDYYADQLRAQARRISQSSKGGFLNPARYQPKPVPDIKSSIVVSRPVDRPPRVQEAQAIIPAMTTTETPPIYRSNNVSKGLNLVGLQSQISDDGAKGYSSPEPQVEYNYNNQQQQQQYGDYAQQQQQQQQQYSPNAPQQNKPYSPNMVKMQYEATQKSSASTSSYSHSPQSSLVGNNNNTTSSSSSSPQQLQQNSAAPSLGHSVLQSPQSSSSSGSSTVVASSTYQQQQQQHYQQQYQQSQQQQQHFGQQPQPQQQHYQQHHHSPQNSGLSVHHSPQNSLASSAFGGSISTAPSSHHSPQISSISNATSGYHSPKSSFSELPTSPTGKDGKDDLSEGPNSYSTESYMSSKYYTRQGFGGNYKRNGEVSPVKPPTTLFPPQQQEGDSTTTKQQQQQQNNNNMDSIKQQQGYSKYDPPPWSNRTRFFGAKPYTAAAPEQPPTSSILNKQGSAEEASEESPSVRSVVKNFEGHRKVSAPVTKEPVTRTKVSEIRDNLARKSNENVHEASGGNGPEYSTTTTKDSTTSSSYSTPVKVVDLSPPNYTPPPIPTETEPSPQQKTDKTPPQPREKPRKKSSKSRKSPQADSVQESSSILRINMNDGAPPLPAKKSVGATPPSPAPVEEPVITPKRADLKPVNISLVDKLSETPPASSSASKSSPKLTPKTTPTSSHVRQKSMEEIACEKQAALVVRQLGEEERQLIEVILPPPEHKTTTDYINGLFDTEVDESRKPSIQMKREKKSAERESNKDSSSYWSPGQKDGKEDLGASNSSLEKQKEHLIEQVQKKIGVLRNEKKAVEEDIQHNNALGKELSAVVEKKVKKAEFDKYKSYVKELDLVTTLLLKLSGRLARADNAIKEGATDQEKMALKHKRDGICGKLDDAKQLKDGIDNRGHQVATFLQQYLTADEFADYDYFVKKKSKLNMKQQEVEDKLNLGEEQLAALQKSLKA